MAQLYLAVFHQWHTQLKLTLGVYRFLDRRASQAHTCAHTHTLTPSPPPLPPTCPPTETLHFTHSLVQTLQDMFIFNQTKYHTRQHATKILHYLLKQSNTKLFMIYLQSISKLHSPDHKVLITKMLTAYHCSSGQFGELCFRER